MSLRDRRIEIYNVDEKGIHFMCWDDDAYNVVHATFSVEEAKELANELHEAARDLKELLEEKSE